ncbi:DUF7692 domain-containing protein [Natronoglomus mannanivorans]|uniref:DUF7692 domain-containing protein n=1 Tax=Natronoglomus mannanivorans TaxID=2979990 RepID=UPI003CCD4CBF
MALRRDPEGRELYDCNRSNAVTFACEDVDQLVHAVGRVLEPPLSTFRPRSRRQRTAR